MARSSSFDPPGGHLAGRVRAAMAWADLDRKQVAEALGVSVRTVGRWRAGEAADQALNVERREQLADLCHVPSTFLELGFAAMASELTDADRAVLDLREQQAQLEDRMQEQLMRTARVFISHARDPVALDDDQLREMIFGTITQDDAGDALERELADPGPRAASRAPDSDGAAPAPRARRGRR